MENVIENKKELKLDKTIKFDILDYVFAIMCFLLFTLNYSSGWNNIVNVIIMAFCGLCVLFNFDRGVKNWTYLLWYLAFILISCLCTLLAKDISVSFSKLFTICLILLIVVSLTLYVDSLERIEKICQILYFTLIVVVLYLLLNENLFSGTRLGTSIGDQNTIGIYISCLSIFTFAEMSKKFSVLKLIAFIFSVLGILLTGSRTSLLCWGCGISVFFILNYKIRLRYIILFLAGLFTLYYLIFKVELFYNVLGIRIESMFEILSGQQSSINEGSTTTRLTYLNEGWLLFLQKPLLGFGYDYFSTIFNTFSHCNYIELLVSGGLVLLIAYYSIYVYIFSSAIKIKDRRYRALIISMAICLLVSDILLVKFYQKPEILFIGLICTFISIIRKKETSLA